MAVDYISHLAAAVISDQRTVTYRALARSLKCHSHAAKRMLFDFYQRENSKKAAAVHATYLLCGRKHLSEQASPSQNGTNGDISMDVPPSSPPFSSSMPADAKGNASNSLEVPCQTITLVREEDLEDVKQSYLHISSVHIYSLEPAPIQDLHIITDCNREIFYDFFVKEDPLNQNQIYGVIHNKYVKRRTGQLPRPPPPAAPAPSKTPKSSTNAPASKLEPKRSDSQNPLSRPGSSTAKSDVKPTQLSTKSSTLRRDSSDIFKSFSKAKDHAKSQQRVNNTGSSDATPVDSATEDTPMKNASSDEGSDDDSTLLGSTNKRTSSSRPTRTEREAKLRKMMEDSEDDEPMPRAQASAAHQRNTLKPAPSSASRPSSASANPPAAVNDEDEAADWSASDHDDAPKDQSMETPATGGPPRRRRGRRQVMKKRTRKDEDGYLVTQEEPVWEDFSEDEPVPASSARVKLVAASSATAVKRETKPAAGTKKGGGGSIMSFFSKK